MSSEMVELVVLAAVAVGVLYWLRGIIGTRTGHEAPPPEVVRRREAERDMSGPVLVQDRPEDDEAPEDDGLDEGSRAALAQIRQLEPDFDLAGFVDGARGAYEMILMGYEEGDRETLQSLLAPDVYQAFAQGIDTREAEGLRVEARFIGVREARVEEVAFEADSNIADVTVRFVGELITAVRDAENRVVEGDPNEIRRQSDLWTFSREMGSRDPNWLLTGTGG